MKELRHQACCHALLSECINGGPSLGAAAVRASRAYAAWAVEAAQHEAPACVVKLECYEGDLRPVQRLASFLTTYDREDLIATVVHGSLGTGEVITYSDFDALIIIRDDTMRDPARLVRLSKRLALARQFMFEHDPLQHHGWFVLTEADLQCYNEAVFPHEVLMHAKLLCRDASLHLKLCLHESTTEALQKFSAVAQSLMHNLSRGWALYNMYHLKNSLSLFMLLPALYVQVRDGRGIFKKFSFEAARSDFSDRDWEPMDRVSSIRERWHYEISPLRRWFLTRPWRFRRQLVRRLAPPIPADLRKLMTPELQEGMGRLASLMAARLDLRCP